MEALRRFLPEGSFDEVISFIHQYRVHLTVSRKRKSVLGDYRHAGPGSNHRISVNGDLNAYEFLITLLHELAHLLTFEQYRNRVEAHGPEWKQCYGRLLQHFVQLGIFPPDITAALQSSIINPAATANGETALLLVLRKYNHKPSPDHIPVADVPEGAYFTTDNGRIYQKGPIRRKRYECVEIKTGLRYSFSAVMEVRVVGEVKG